VFSDISLYFPPTKVEQDKISQILSDMDYEIEQLKDKKSKYQSVKQGMMQELLTGKTRLI
jgi:type I restriction enzyme S subunit